MMKFNNFGIYSKPFKIQEKILAIPELWSSLDWDNKCFENYIKPFVESQFNAITYADDEFLKIKDIAFFKAIENCNFLTIFTAIPDDINLSYESKICQKSCLMKDIIHNIISIGWNPRCEINSAFIEGLYPIHLEGNNLIYCDEYDEIPINNFGLLTNLKDCQYLCDLNNQHPMNQDYWYPSEIYVDCNTYRIIHANTPNTP